MARARKSKAATNDAVEVQAEEGDEVLEPDALTDAEDVDMDEDDAISDDSDYDSDDESGDDDDAPDLDEVLADANANGLSVRREIERRLEERRLARDLDDLDFDFD